MMPPKVEASEAMLKVLSHCIEHGEFLSWSVQLHSGNAKALSRCTPDDLKSAADLILNQMTWMNFAEFRNEKVQRFIASGSDLTFAQWLKTEE